MTNKLLTVLLSAILMLLSAALTSGQRRSSGSRRPYDTQMTQLRNNLQMVDEELEENRRAIEKIVQGMGLDVAKAENKLADGPPELSGAISKIKDALRVWEIAENFRDARYEEALLNSTKLLITSLSKLSPPGRAAGTAVTIGEYLLLKPIQLLALTVYHNKLVQSRLNIEKAYNTVQYRQNQTDFEKWLRNLRGDPEEARLAVRELMKQIQTDPQHIAGAIISESSSVSAVAAHNVGRGMTIIDPDQAIWDLGKIPGINSDFIAALERCKNAEAAWSRHPRMENYVAAMTCNKYPDGSYILPNSPSRGLRSSATGEVGSARKSRRVASNTEGMPLSSGQPTVSSSDSDKMAGSVSARKPSDITFRSTEPGDMWHEYTYDPSKSNSRVFESDLKKAELLFQQFKTVIAGRTLTRAFRDGTIGPDEVTLTQVYEIGSVTTEVHRKGQQKKGTILWREGKLLQLMMDPKDETHWKWSYYEHELVSDDPEALRHHLCLGTLKKTGPSSFTNQCVQTGPDWNKSVEVSLQVINGQLQARITTTTKAKSWVDGSIEQTVEVETVTAHFTDAWAWEFQENIW